MSTHENDWDLLNDYWYVDFSAENDYIPGGTRCPLMTGKLWVAAKDIFEALEQASVKLKSFAFSKFTLIRAGYGRNGEERKE